MTDKEARRQIKSLQQAAREIGSTPEKVRAFLIKAGILAKNGKGLAAKYR